MPSSVDLHIHTNASDGTDSPENLLWEIQKAGIKIFAITDHDTINGALKMKKILPAGMRFIQGIEFSCRTNNAKCHILGLNYDEHNLDFQAALRTGDNLRHQKFHKRIELLRTKFNINFSQDEINLLLRTPSVGKPHIANLLVSKGLAANKQEAIDRYIDKCKTGASRIEASYAIKAIISAGGVPVWTHPLGGEGEAELSEDAFRETLTELISYGLRGLECYYSKYEIAKCQWLEYFAKQNGLLISGGSDYHGRNKNIPLGKLNARNQIIDAKTLTILRSLNL